MCTMSCPFVKICCGFEVDLRLPMDSVLVRALKLLIFKKFGLTHLCDGGRCALGYFHFKLSCAHVLDLRLAMAWMLVHPFELNIFKKTE